MGRIKYLVSLLLIMGIAVFASGCGTQKAADNTAKNTLEQVKEKGVLVAGLDDTFAPMGFHDEKTNDLVGFDIDMGTELSKRLGVKMKWQPTEWNGVTGALNSKKFDVIISGMSVTPERQKAINFSRNYLNAGIGMVVKSDNTSIKESSDLKDKKIGTQAGSSGLDACKQLGLENVTLYDQYPEAFNDLATGRSDVVVVDLTTAAHFMSKQPGKFKVVGNRLVEEPYAIGLRKDAPELKAAIDQALTDMIKDGTLSKISQKWFGDDITPKAE